MLRNIEFELHFALPPSQSDAEAWLDTLFEAGCDDALIGVAVPGRVSVSFAREGEEIMAVLLGAIADVTGAISGSVLMSAGPDLLNLTEIAERLTEHGAPITRQAITRQAMRKYAAGEARKLATPFPAPAISGGTPLWHLDDVLTWMAYEKKLPGLPGVAALRALAGATRALNVVCEYHRARAESPALMAAVEEKLTTRRMDAGRSPGVC